MKKTGIFITGTDTGVGKTYIGAGIAKTLRSRGIDVGVMKPAETGCRSTRTGLLSPRDSLHLTKQSGVTDSLELINPYRFKNSLAPSVAARLEGRKIQRAKILKSYHALARRHAFMIVEGAGGIMVPLSEEYLFLDLAVEIDLPVIIVARPGLGTINHTLLTIAALRQKKVTIAGMVINYSSSGKKGLAETTSPPAIEKISRVKVLAIAGYKSVNFDQLADLIA